MIKFITETSDYLKSKGFDSPEVGIILGTGLGQLTDEIEHITNPKKKKPAKPGEGRKQRFKRIFIILFSMLFITLAVSAIWKAKSEVQENPKKYIPVSIRVIN